ncbi:MAG: hypothetical protein FWD69_07940 [Polyangiaceae bacterium]|nr:hypothetical protein [Polyangiaceae bacterium]
MNPKPEAPIDDKTLDSLVAAWKPALDFFESAISSDEEADRLLDFILPSRYIVLGGPNDATFGIHTATVFVKDAISHRHAHRRILALLLQRDFLIDVAEANAEDEKKARAAMKRGFN